jgi:nitroreductase
MVTPEQANTLIRNRRSIFPKSYIDKPISKEIIEEILENANWAPTHRMTEPWRFVVFQGEALKRLGQTLAEMYKDYVSEEKFQERKYEKTLHKPSKCGAVIAICMNRDEEERVPEFEEIAAVACAVQNMWLSASAYGIGSYWSTPGYIKTQAMKDFIGLGKKDKCLGFFYMGYHEMPHIEGKRTPIKDKVVWVK